MTTSTLTVVHFSGASDDLVHVDGWDDKFDEVSFYNKEYFILRAFGMAAVVRPHYTGTWGFEINMLDEDTPMIPLYARFLPSETCDYSVTLQLNVPTGTTCEYVQQD